MPNERRDQPRKLGHDRKLLKPSVSHLSLVQLGQVQSSGLSMLATRASILSSPEDKILLIKSLKSSFGFLLIYGFRSGRGRSRGASFASMSCFKSLSQTM